MRYMVGRTHSFANTPLRAAHAPLARLKTIHCFFCTHESRRILMFPAAMSLSLDGEAVGADVDGGAGRLPNLSIYHSLHDNLKTLHVT